MTRKEILEIINSPITGILLGSKVYQNLKSHRIPFLITTHIVLKVIERTFGNREGCLNSVKYGTEKLYSLLTTIYSKTRIVRIRYRSTKRNNKKLSKRQKGYF